MGHSPYTCGSPNAHEDLAIAEEIVAINLLGTLRITANPITLVRCSTKRLRTPSMLTASELRKLLDALPYRERLMGVICATTGLRICEVLGLKWQDIHFEVSTADVLRSFVDGVIGPCKTETSQQAIPLDEFVIGGLRLWQAETAYSKLDYWVYPSDRKFGAMPLWPDSRERRCSNAPPSGPGSRSGSAGIVSGTAIVRCWPIPATIWGWSGNLCGTPS